MNRNQFIIETSVKLYLKLPFWKRWQFTKWEKSNNWDVKSVYKDCIDEATMMAKTLDI